MVWFLSLLLVGGCTGLLDQVTGGGEGSSSSSGGDDEPTEALVPIRGGSGSTSTARTAAPEEQAASTSSEHKGRLEPGMLFEMKEKQGVIVRPGSISGPPAPVEGIHRKQCGDMSDGGPVHGPDCITAEIECGQTIIGHTVGGVNRFNTRFYEKYFCTPATTNHDGGNERVYYLRAPEKRQRLWITLDTPCADLDMAVMRVNGKKCPTMENGSQDCDMWPKPGNKREVVDMTTMGDSEWLIVVEGKDDEEGAFAVTVQCVDW